METAQTAARLLRSLKDNANAYHLGKIDYDLFGIRGRAIWDVIGRSGPAVAQLVAAGLRANLAEA